MTSTETAARFLALYESRRALPDICRRAQQLARQFRDIVLDQTSRYTPRHAGEVYRRVQDDYGSVGRRRVERALAKLLCDGAIERTPDGYVRRPS